MILIFSGLALPWLIVGFGCWLGYQLLRQNGRMLLRLQALEQRLAQLAAPPSPAPAAPAPPPALPAGSVAPDFELPNLAGGRTSLSQLRGRRLLLIFFNPRCGFCTRMAPDLAALPVDGADGRPLPVVVSTGETAENRTLVQESGIRCPVLIQEQMEVASRYQAQGTPMGYLIDEQGRIASEIAVGAQALLALAEERAGEIAAVNGNGHHPHRGNRDLADSRLNRKGLPAGTPAPDFTLPTLDGAEISLAAYRGRRLLLVFSDPNCGPCNQLAPQLEQFHRRTAAVEILMVSRGDREANRAKAQEHGLTFPTVLQKQWEVSREYAIFATPIAYWIDEHGITAEEVAVGVEPILALLARASGPEAILPRRCGCGKPTGECACRKKQGRAVAASRRGR